MRAGSIEPPRSGSVLLLAGSLLLALALLLLSYRQLIGRENGAVAPAPKDALAATNGVISFWEQRVHDNPGDFIGYDKLAEAYARRARATNDVSDYSRAEAAARASLRELPGDNYNALAMLASLQATKHDFQGALETAQRAIVVDPVDPYAQGVLGDAKMALGRYDEASQTYEGLVAKAPGLSTFSRLAYILEQRGETDAAELAWQNALSTDGGRQPDNTAWARVQFGNFYFTRGDLEKAEAQYEASLRAFPGYAHALAGLAKVHAARGDYGEATSLYEQVVARQPTPEYVSALGDVYRAAGRPDDADRQYALVEAIDRLYKANGINTDLQMALFFADHDLRLDDAVSQARAVYEQRSGSVPVADVLAWALYKDGRYDEGLGYSQEALRLGTRDSLLLFHAGMIEFRLGNHDKAREYLGAALQINPRFSVLYADEAAATLDDLDKLR
ncbi:MAG: tetratricopeptide repeat protein [Chloroflexi bacterium]|nr:MAG: tetratricopeptide repeat protein [Chloroflexota bacterium]